MNFWEKIKTDSNIGAAALGEIALDTLIGLAENHAAHRTLDRMEIPTMRESRRLTLVERIKLVKE